MIAIFGIDHVGKSIRRYPLYVLPLRPCGDPRKEFSISTRGYHASFDHLGCCGQRFLIPKPNVVTLDASPFESCLEDPAANEPGTLYPAIRP